MKDIKGSGKGEEGKLEEFSEGRRNEGKENGTEAEIEQSKERGKKSNKRQRTEKR